MMNPETKWFINALTRAMVDAFGTNYNWVLIIDKENRHIETKVVCDGPQFPGYWWTFDLTEQTSRATMRRVLKEGISHMKQEVPVA